MMGLWERLAAAIVLTRGCKPLPPVSFLGYLSLPDKRIIFFLDHHNVVFIFHFGRCLDVEL